MRYEQYTTKYYYSYMCKYLGSFLCFWQKSIMLAKAAFIWSKNNSFLFILF